MTRAYEAYAASVGGYAAALSNVSSFACLEGGAADNFDAVGTDAACVSFPPAARPGSVWESCFRWAGGRRTKINFYAVLCCVVLCCVVAAAAKRCIKSVVVLCCVVL